MTNSALSPVVVERDADVTILRLAAGENRFNPDSLTSIEAALDQLEQDPAPGALVLTGEGKFFSNGLDLDWLSTASDEGRADVLRRVHALLARVLAFPTATVAAINGHAFAAGAMLALACDFRVMRADRGFVCLPEVDLGLPFTPGMSALLRGRLAPSIATRAMVFGERFTADQALAAGLVDEVAAEAEVLGRATDRVRPLAGKKRFAVQAIKRELYRDALATLARDASEGGR